MSVLKNLGFSKRKEVGEGRLKKDASPMDDSNVKERPEDHHETGGCCGGCCGGCGGTQETNS